MQTLFSLTSTSRLLPQHNERIKHEARNEEINLILETGLEWNARVSYLRVLFDAQKDFNAQAVMETQSFFQFLSRNIGPAYSGWM